MSIGASTIRKNGDINTNYIALTFNIKINITYKNQNLQQITSNSIKQCQFYQDKYLEFTNIDFCQITAKIFFNWLEITNIQKS